MMNSAFGGTSVFITDGRGSELFEAKINRVAVSIRIRFSRIPILTATPIILSYRALCTMRPDGCDVLIDNLFLEFISCNA
jgi:hypothetical protein